MFQIRRLLQRSTSKNCFSSAQIHTLEHLKDRTLLSLTGVEVPEFLQGLITNDINHLQNGAGSMFTMFLNTKGRVLFDSIVYRVADNTYFVECDSSIVDKMQKHLKMYQLRRKIKMNNMSDQFQVYALFDGEIVKNIKGICSGDDKKRDKVKLGDANETTSNKMLVFNDPRLNHLGKRVLIEPGTNVDQINSIGPYEVSKSPKYKFLRYNLGVGEGTLDFPIGDCLPLENNLDYLHGVSFHKGCYIGQELTARTYHTGVIRKRLMPLYFESPLKTIPDDLNIVNNDVKLGKLRGVDGNVGLAILRIVQALELGSIKVGGKNADVLRPFWWPVELPKVKASARTL